MSRQESSETVFVFKALRFFFSVCKLLKGANDKFWPQCLQPLCSKRKQNRISHDQIARKTHCVFTRSKNGNFGIVFLNKKRLLSLQKQMENGNQDEFVIEFFIKTASGGNPGIHEFSAAKNKTN